MSENGASRNRNRSFRLYVPFILFAMMIGYAVHGLVRVQLLERERYVSLLNSLLGKNKYERGLRGTIYSSDGVKIAWSERIPVLRLDNPEHEDLEKLGRHLSEEQIAVLRNTGEVQVSWEQAYFLKRLGFSTTVKEIRNSYGFLYHIVGSVNVDGDGTSGLEMTYNEVLKGKAGVSFELRAPGGEHSTGVIVTEPENGLDLTTTIDFQLQKFVAKTLSEVATPSVAIVSEVETGNILAMVSYPFPEFDLNKIDNVTWRKLNSDPLKPLLNRAVSNIYPPGSTFKVVTAISDLAYGDKDRTLHCTGKFLYRDSQGRVTAVFNDWLKSGHGLVNLTKALRVSCNVFFYTVGNELGIDKLLSVAGKLGLGQRTGIPLPGEVESLIPSPEWKKRTIGEPWYPGDTILFSIGQGYVAVTPIQILTLYNTIANRGQRVAPRLIATEQVRKSKVDLPLEEADWNKIIRGLEEVASVRGRASEAGTASKALHDFPLKVAAKTGTAQTGNKPAHGWIVCFVPSYKPMYSVLVLVEHGRSGGLVAGPIARRILNYMYENGYFHDRLR